MVSALKPAHLLKIFAQVLPAQFPDSLPVGAAARLSKAVILSDRVVNNLPTKESSSLYCRSENRVIA